MGRRQPTTKYFVAILIAFIALICHCSDSQAGSNQEVRLFVVEKSKNPQNILVVYAKVNTECILQPIADAGALHLFDFYWLMDGTDFKPTHRLIKKAARKRFLPLRQSIQDQQFTVALADLKELNHDLPSGRVKVEIYRDTKEACRAKAVLKLGPTHANRTMAINTIYSKAKTFLSIPVGIHYIELRGKDVESNEPITARFNSRNEYDDEEMDNAYR